MCSSLPWYVWYQKTMFDREGNEQYLLLNQQLDVVWKKADFSIKRQSGRITSVVHYQKICPTDEQQSSFHQWVLERNWVASWLQGISSWQSNWANFPRKIGKKPAGHQMVLRAGSSPSAPLAMATSLRTPKKKWENLSALSIRLEIEASAIIYVDDPD